MTKSKTQLAIDNGRTIYTNNVYDSISHNGRLLKVSSNKKLGKTKIVKGRHKGKYIYSLSLEERKTCPTSCFHWKTCYGNNMPFAHRFMGNDALMKRLDDELNILYDAVISNPYQIAGKDRFDTDFIQAMNGLAGGSFVPVPGGVLILGQAGAVLGAIGVSGDTSDNDEKAALGGVVAAGLNAESG